jgi:hypothetical protein
MGSFSPPPECRLPPLHCCSVFLPLQIVRRITERGYRNISGSKNPDASITGALSRDILFTRLGPATYALAVRVTSHTNHNNSGL